VPVSVSVSVSVPGKREECHVNRQDAKGAKTISCLLASSFALLAFLAVRSGGRAAGSEAVGQWCHVNHEDARDATTLSR
jgi:hypothetical protein